MYGLPVGNDLLNVMKVLPEDHQIDLGKIVGKRVLDIQSAYPCRVLDSAFDGKNSIFLERNSPEYSEVESLDSIVIMNSSVSGQRLLICHQTGWAMQGSSGSI